jgi:hypothetical protein
MVLAALPLLWAVLDSEMEACMPAHQIRVACGNIQLLEGGANPANKASLVVTGQESQVRIDPLNDDSDNGEQEGNKDHEQAGVILHNCRNNHNQANKIWALNAQGASQREVQQLA